MGKYLVKGDDVDSAAERDVLGVEAEDPAVLEAALREGVVGGDGGGEDGRDHEGQDVQAVQQDLVHRALAIF